MSGEGKGHITRFIPNGEELYVFHMHPDACELREKRKRGELKSPEGIF